MSNAVLIQIVLGGVLTVGGIYGLSRKKFALGLGGPGAGLGSHIRITLSPPVAIIPNILVVIGGVIELVTIFVPELMFVGLAIAVFGSMIVGLVLQVAYSLHQRLMSRKE